MGTLERVLWTAGALAACAFAFYTLFLPEEDARRLWGDNDPAWCAPVGILILAGCIGWIWQHARREGRS